MASGKCFARDGVEPSEVPVLSRRALFVGVAAAGASLSVVGQSTCAAAADRATDTDPRALDYRETMHVRAAYARMRF